MRTFPNMKGINSQASEQVNYLLQRIKRQVMYMSHQHFMFTVRNFITELNAQKSEKILKQLTKDVKIEEEILKLKQIIRLYDNEPSYRAEISAVISSLEEFRAKNKANQLRHLCFACMSKDACSCSF